MLSEVHHVDGVSHVGIWLGATVDPEYSATSFLLLKANSSSCKFSSKKVISLAVLMLNVFQSPAGKEFTVEISANRATTTLSYDGRYISDWVDGQQHNDAFVRLSFTTLFEWI